MIRERDKSRKILNALIDYYVSREFSVLNTSINIEGEVTNIDISGSIDISGIDLDKINHLLDHPRIHEYDDTYDNLLQSNDEEELFAIGYLIDEAKVNFDGNTLSINLIRKH